VQCTDIIFLQLKGWSTVITSDGFGRDGRKGFEPAADYFPPTTVPLPSSPPLSKDFGKLMARSLMYATRNQYLSALLVETDGNCGKVTHECHK
jgi:hypothetical protein